jgi:hypothetical protein
MHLEPYVCTRIVYSSYHICPECDIHILDIKRHIKTQHVSTSIDTTEVTTRNKQGRRGRVTVGTTRGFPTLEDPPQSSNRPMSK